MTKQINRNFFSAKLLIDELAKNGVVNFFISPGSRNTSLTLAAAHNPNIKKFIIIDERSSGFFALGASNESNIPSVLICTSGTAAVEYYPAIVEAFKQHIPLIIITADRPEGLSNLGANQAINQKELYKNHICKSINLSSPQNKISYYTEIIQSAYDAAYFAANLCGPVHINFPLDKPFEPETYTDEIKEVIENYVLNYKAERHVQKDIYFDINDSDLTRHDKGLICVGPSRLNNEEINGIISFSEITGYPIIAEKSSNIHISKNKNIIDNYDVFFRNLINFSFMPDVVLQIGLFPASKGYEDFLKIYKGKLFIPKYGQSFVNPFRKDAVLIDLPFEQYITSVLKNLKDRNFLKSNSDYLSELIGINNRINDIKTSFDCDLSFELYKEIFNLVPEDSNLVVSNSLIIRDFELFSGLNKKGIKVFTTRGASGIDGQISHASGISASSGKPVYLLIGDLAFYYDISALLMSINNNISLKIILINNNGGGIFKTLPINKYEDTFDKYFNTPLNVDFEPLIKGFGFDYALINNKQEINIIKNNSSKNIVFEIKSNSSATIDVRQKYLLQAKDCFL